MAEQRRQSPSGFKRMSLDKIIEAMTADLDNSAGHYVQFGGAQQQSSGGNWGDYASVQRQRFASNQAVVQNQGNSQNVINPMTPQIYMEDLASFEANRTQAVYFPPRTMNHLGINENNDLVGSIDVGGGNYIDVIYGNASQLVAEQCQINGLASYADGSSVEREYGLFGEHRQRQQSPINHNKLTNRSANGGQLIDNLVGNWAPNQSGTYSPFGGSPDVTHSPRSNARTNDGTETSARKIAAVNEKKPRMIAEVKPMRPSYSDVLTKSPPLPVSPVTGISAKPQLDPSAQKKITNKNGRNKSKATSLKRQNSSGSDDHGSPKIQMPKRSFERNGANLRRRWVSLDNLGSQLESREINAFNGSDNFEKKKSGRGAKRCEKTTTEALNNCKFHSGNSKTTANTQKRPIQINNNLNNINNYNNSPSNEKIEKNQHANNKITKDEKKNAKEKNSKRFHADKAQQMKKGQKYRYRDNRESPVKDLCRNFNKYAGRWSKFGLKMFYWLLHLISDVTSMSVNLVVQFCTCLWYHTVLYMKYSWIYVATTFSKVQFLNKFCKRIDDCFGNSKFAFWRRMRSKNNEDKEEHRSWMHGGLDANIALPSTGEEAMKRLLACKGKDPYSILGVTPTCSDDDIKKYYKRQAFLVHPDKNSQPGAEEAFKILVHAFDIIGEPERRKAFDQVWQVEAAWGEMSGLLSQLHRKMEQAANTIRCTNCGLRHKRVPTQRPCYAARFCAQCKIRHSTKEGDIWAESRIMGFLWHYYACMEGAVYDVTEWAACQAGNLKHLRANTHSVQYRIVSGQRPPSQTSTGGGKRRQQNDPSTSEADLEDFLNNLYNYSKSGTAGSAGEQQTSAKCENRRRKAKRK